jgi:hypothetical protein
LLERRLANDDKAGVVFRPNADIGPACAARICSVRSTPSCWPAAPARQRDLPVPGAS